MANDPFGARTTLETGSADVELYSLKTLDENVDGDVFSLPFSIRVMLESLLRNAGGKFVSKEDVEALASWPSRRRACVFAGQGRHAGLYRGACGRRPRGDAERDGERGGIRAGSTRSCRPIWLSTTRSRSTLSDLRPPFSSTPSASSSATASATSF